MAGTQRPNTSQISLLHIQASKKSKAMRDITSSRHLTARLPPMHGRAQGIHQQDTRVITNLEQRKQLSRCVRPGGPICSHLGRNLHSHPPHGPLNWPGTSGKPVPRTCHLGGPEMFQESPGQHLLAPNPDSRSAV